MNNLGVVAAAQRYVATGNSSEMREFDVAELKKANYQLGDRDANTGWRKAIQDLIFSSAISNNLDGGVFNTAPNLNTIFTLALFFPNSMSET